MDNPLVSVVMPHFNATQVVSNAIMSIVNQTYKNWELVIVDDGSDDIETLERIVNNFGNDRIKLIKNKHLDVVRTRMTGYIEASGDILAVQDADDLSMPDRLERAVKAFQKDPELDVYCHGIYVNMWYGFASCILREYRRNPIIDRDRLLQEQTLNGVPIFRRRILEKKPLRLKTQYAYDWMMHLDWVLSGAKYKLDNRGLYEYVRHENSLSERNERIGNRHKSLLQMSKILKNEYNVEFKPKDWET